jgi:hypothetical protein
LRIVEIRACVVEGEFREMPRRVRVMDGLERDF